MYILCRFACCCVNYFRSCREFEEDKILTLASSAKLNKNEYRCASPPFYTHIINIHISYSLDNHLLDTLAIYIHTPIISYYHGFATDFIAFCAGKGGENDKVKQSTHVGIGV